MKYWARPGSLSWTRSLSGSEGWSWSDDC